MKNHIYFRIFAQTFSTLVILSCVAGDDFKIPDTTIAEPVIQGEIVQIAALTGLYDQEFENVTIENTNTYLEGYVISSDEAGNFFEEIVLQDSPMDPSYGIRLLVDVNPLFTRYEVGRKLFIKLDGLTVGISNGVLSLGIAGVEFIEKIPFPLEEEFIIRSTVRDSIVPVPLSLEDLPDLNFEDDFYELANRWVLIEDVQFNKEDVLGDYPLTYAAEGSDRFDGERNLESCLSDKTVIFSTSTFADFKSLLLPSGRGSIEALLTKNFFGDEWNLVVNDPSTVNLFDEDRCDEDD